MTAACGDAISAALCAELGRKARRQDGKKPPSPRRARRLLRVLGKRALRPPAALTFYLLARLERLELERLFERDGLLRRVVRDVLRDAVRRFVPVLRRAVDLRPLDFRDVDLRDVDFRPADLRVVLRDEVLRAVALRPVLLRADVLRADVLRADDDFRRDDLRVAAVLPERSRRLVFARLRLFSDGLS